MGIAGTAGIVAGMAGAGMVVVGGTIISGPAAGPFLFSKPEILFVKPLRSEGLARAMIKTTIRPIAIAAISAGPTN
jgi:hypothetical protein